MASPEQVRRLTARHVDMINRGDAGLAAGAGRGRLRRPGGGAGRSSGLEGICVDFRRVCRVYGGLRTDAVDSARLRAAILREEALLVGARRR